MDAQETPRDLGTPARNALRDRLLDCNAPQLAEAYEATVELLSRADFPARRHLLAHLVRDIAEGLPEVVTGDKIMRVDTTKALTELAQAWSREMPEPSPFEPSETPPAATVPVPARLAAQVSRLVADQQRVMLNRRDKFALLMEALRPGSQALRPALEPVIRGWVEIARWFQGHAHVRRDAEALPADDAEAQRQAEAKLQRQFRHFEDGLRGILAGHFEVTHEIDAVLESSPPGAETLERLMPLLGGAQQIHHFFERIVDPAWLEPLEQRKLLTPPDPIRDESRETVAYWSWPAGPYLKRVASVPEAQNAVARIAVGIKTDNVRAHDDIGDIALALPPRLAAQLADVLVHALSMPSSLSLLDKKAAVLTESLAAAGERTAAHQLLKALVEVVPDRAEATTPFSPTPRTRVNHHALDRLFDQHLAGIVSGLGLDALEILCGALDRAMRLSGRGDPDESIEDHSYIWRPAIEHGARSNARDVLVTAVLRAAEQLAGSDPRTVPAVLDCLEQRGWLVFRRIALHVIRALPTPPPDLVAPRLLDRTLFDHFITCHEYRMLLQQCFGSLAEEQRREWLGWTEAGRPDAEVRAFLERWSGKTATAADIAETQRKWQWARLGLIRDLLPPDWKQRYAALEREFGQPPTADDYRVRVRAGALRLESPKTPDELRAMSLDEIVAYLKSWSPSSEQPFVTPQALADEIEKLVAESPVSFARYAGCFEGVPPTYLKAAIRGLRQAQRERRDFEWPPVLALAAWVLRQPIVEPEPVWDGIQNPGWGWTRQAIIDLLQEALKQEPSPLSLDARETVWSLLAVLCEDPSPQRRGDAIEASVRYAEWVRISAGQPWAGSGTLDDVPEVRGVIDAAVDLSTAPVPRVYEAIGHQLPWLIFMDEAWVRTRLPRIFPVEPEHTDLWQAAWHAYLYAGVPKLSDRVFSALISVYAEAVARLCPEAEEASADRDAPERLSEHLTVFYGRGTLEAQGATGLLDRFFERANLSLRQHLHWYVGHSLDEETAPLSPDVLRRLQQLWQKRRDVAVSQPDVRAELPAFGMWFGCCVFDADWRLDQLELVLQACGEVDYDHRVAEHLAELAERHTAAVMRCCALAVRAMKNQQSAFGWTDQGHIKTILAAALRSGDATAQAQAIETFHRLGSLGFRAHELLAFSNDLDDPATIAYFTWDHPMTVAEIRKRLTEASEPERDRMLGQILREAKDTDVWKFTTPQEVQQRWPQIERHLGRRREFWTSLLGAWKEQGLLAGPHHADAAPPPQPAVLRRS